MGYKWGKIGKLVIMVLACVLTSTQGHTQVRKGLHWSKDGNAYYQLEGGNIIKYSLPTFSKDTIVRKSQLLNEKGAPLKVKDFEFSEDGSKLLVYAESKKVWRYETRGNYWLFELASKQFHQLGKGLPPSSMMFAKLSPDAAQVAYVSQHNLYTENLTTHQIQQLTQDGTDRIINGTFDWVYEEEFDCRDGFRWSPDSKQIAYWQIDARKIRNFLLINNTDSIYSYTTPVEYPKVGEDPSVCKIGVVSIASGETKWMGIPGDSIQHYIPRMEWVQPGQLIVQQLNRKQNESIILLANASTGVATPIYTETNKAWIDIKSRWDKDDPTGWEFINKGKSFIWVSEKDGWRHIYTITIDGKKETLLTKGDYDMISLESIDQANGFVYFTASPTNATQAYLYRVPLNGSGKLELISPTNQKGVHRYDVSPNGSFASHQFSNHYTTPISEWVSLPKHLVVKESAAKPVEHRDNLVEMIQVTTADGITMDGWMIKPENFDSTKKYPVVFYVYTEPGSSTVADSYGKANTFLYGGNMAADGYIQISLDGRGTPVPKGAAWRKSIYRKVGVINVRDQAMAAKKIIEWPFVDKNRIAVWGWSGGGSTTLNLLFQYPDIYQTGVAIAPVASRLTYDNIYEERYMGLPQENREDYIQASAITHANGLKGHLLLVHGTGDDNVHYQNSELLINELVKYNKDFQLMSYPNRTHGLREGDGTLMHLVTMFTKYIQTNCPGGGR